MNIHDALHQFLGTDSPSTHGPVSKPEAPTPPVQEISVSSNIWKITETINISYLGGYSSKSVSATHYSDKPPSDKINPSILSREVTEGTVVWGETKKTKLGWIDG